MSQSKRSFVEDIKSIHESIQFGDYDDVKEVLDRYPNEKYFLNKKIESVAMIALKYKRYEIYELLISKGFWLAPHEDSKTIIKQKYNAKEEAKIKEIHEKYFKGLKDTHLIALVLKSKLSHDASESEMRELYDMISKAYSDLNESEWMKPIMQIVSTVSNLNIVFDFNRESIVGLDPTKSRHVRGAMYPSELRVKIGALGLRYGSTRHAVLGTMIHEFCHLVMKVVYKNNANPYTSGNVERQLEFNEIIIKCGEKKESENLINAVFLNYEITKQHSEMIVRVPHLEAFYRNNSDKYLEVTENFSGLFEFYEKNTLVDMKLHYPMLETKNQFIELNNLCGISNDLKMSKIFLNSQALNLELNATEKVIYITSNCCEVTMKTIYQQLETRERFESSYIFVELRTLRIPAIFDIIVKTYNFHTQPTVIVDCADQEEKLFPDVAQKLIESGVDRRLIFVSENSLSMGSIFNHSYTFSLNHVWSNFEKEYKNELLKTPINFQGMEKILVDLVDNQAQNVINSIPLKLLIKQHSIKIGKEIKFKEVKFYVTRKYFCHNTSNPIILASKKMSSDEVINMAKTHGVILFSEEPGIGKSTEIKMMAMRLKTTLQSHWVLFIDLKEHYKAYQKDGNISFDFTKRDVIAQFLSEKILKVDSFEAKLFMHLFNSNRTIILIDGVDEICPTFKTFIFDLMKGIRKQSQNQMWIATRPHLMEQLKANLQLNKSSLFHLYPFSNEDCITFFYQVFESNNILNKNIDRKIDEIKKFVDVLRNDINPLLMRMVAEIINEDSNIDLSMLDLFSIYEIFTSKIIARCNKKGPEGEKNIEKFYGNSDIMIYFQTKAFNKVFQGYEQMKEIIKFFITFDTCPTEDDVIRVGIMYSDGSENLHFIHQTFAEFFVAKFLKQNLLQNKCSNEKRYVIAKILENILKDDGFSMVRIFLNHAFQPSHHEIFLNNFKLLKIHFVQSFDDVVAYWLNLLIQDKCLQMLDFFWQFALACNGTDRLKKFLTTRINSRPIFHLSLLNSNVQVFNFLSKQAETLLSLEEFQKLLMSTDVNGWTLFHYVLEAQLSFENIFKFLYQKLSRDQVNKLLRTTKCGSVLLLACQEGKSLSNLICVCEALHKIFPNLNDLREYFLQICIQEIKVVAELGTVDHFKVLWNFMKGFLNQGELENFLFEKNFQLLTVFHFAVKSQHEDLFDHVKNLYTGMFSEDKMKILILSEVQNNGSILSEAIGALHVNGNGKNIQALWFYLRELLDVVELKFILTRSINSRQESIFDELEKLNNYDLLHLLTSFVDKFLPAADEFRKRVMRQFQKVDQKS